MQQELEQLRNWIFYKMKNQGVNADEVFDTIFSRNRDTGIGGAL